MASKRIDIVLQGTDSTGKAFEQVYSRTEQLKKSAGDAGNAIGGQIPAGANKAAGALGALGSKGSSAMSQLANSASGLSTAIAGLAGSYGLMEVAQSAWAGATSRQFNQAYLATKMGTEGAIKMQQSIADIVAKVPGDDAFLNQILTGAVAKQTNLTTKELEDMGYAVADYYTVSRAMGKAQLETQMDLKEYILTGNTGQLERDSILKMQLETLKGHATVTERVKALQAALAKEGYAGLSKLDIASIKWETTLGKIQQKITDLGMAALSIIEPILDGFLWLDEVTNGWSTTLIVGGGLIVIALVSIIGVIGILADLFIAAGTAVTTLAGTFGLASAGAIELGAAATIAEIALGPVGWIILAITAAVAAGVVIWTLWGDEITAWGQSTYLWLEKIGQLIWTGDWGAAAKELGAGFKNAGQMIWEGLQTAGKVIGDFFSNLPSYIGSAATAMVDFGSNLVDWLIEGLTSLGDYLDEVIAAMLAEPAEGGSAAEAGKKTGNSLIDGLVTWIQNNGPKIKQTLIEIMLKLIPLLGEIALKIGWIIIYKIYEGIISIGYMIGTAISTAFWDGVARAKQIWNDFKAWLWANTVGVVVRVGIEGIQWVKDQWNGLKNWFWSNPIVQKVQALFSGPSGPAGIGAARGPGIGLHYENYAGHQKNAWNASGTGLSGNCVDMTLGLMAGYGGSMVAGTWNGGPHVWWQAPSGQQLDPARKAIDGTWTPPARGPGNGNFGNIVINGDIYGYNDFVKKVEQANENIGFKARRF